MKPVVQLVLNFLLNAIWQVTAIALAAVMGNYLLRSVTRFRHALWVIALTMSLALPIFSVLISMKSETAPAVGEQTKTIEPVTVAPASLVASNVPSAATSAAPGFHVSQRVAIVVLIAFLVLLAYRAAKLFRAWLKTRAIQRSAASFAPDADLGAIIERCRSALGANNARISSSRMIKTPATVGVLNPLVILPEELLSDGDANALTAAIGHELVHVARRDYLLNLIYELIFLPLSFHPAAALMKRQITKTRELRCDELVVERLLHHEVYARSLVRLAGWALPLNRRAQTIVVGIADADILEVRIMSLLKKTKSTFRRTVLLVVGAAVLLAIPCIAAASFGFNFNIDTAAAQDPENELKTGLRAKRAREEAEVAARRLDRQIAELKQAIEQAPNPAARAKAEQELKELMEEKRAYAFTMDGKTYAMAKIDEEGQRREREMKDKQVAELARLARISMDQAIQIATSKTPGKVLECSLVGERWSGPGELAKPSVVLYHVVILAGDEANSVTYHVLVNAVDGSVVKTEREERKTANPEYSSVGREGRPPIEGGTLNGNALVLPKPEYPAVARAARAEGPVVVRILIDKTGHVIWAQAVSGHPLLQPAAVAAAKEATFAPTRLKGEPVTVSGTIMYNFKVQ